MASLTDPSVTALTSTNDAWASVLANVAPLMILVGERHAKEYIRTMSTFPEVLLLAFAPIGILSILISSIRLVGAPVLRRLIGRDSERKADAMVELTPISVELATPVFTDGQVEIKPSVPEERAFLCIHSPHIWNIHDALDAFRRLWVPRMKGVEVDRDFELIMVLRGCQMDLATSGRLVESLANGLAMTGAFPVAASEASVSFRASGISPIQTAGYGGSRSDRLRDAITALAFFLMNFAVLVLDWKSRPFPDLVCMSAIGYMGVVVATAGLLQLVKDAVTLEVEHIPKAFESSLWTTSNIHHSKHYTIIPPKANTLVTVAPAKLGSQSRKTREMQTLLLSILLIASYVTFYLGVRVASWWVELSLLVILWAAAVCRALYVRTSYSLADPPLGEHWTGLFRCTFTQSIEATINSSERHPPGNVLIMFSSPTHIMLGTWSGGQDILKVALELVKRRVLTSGCCAESVAIQSRTWTFVVRFRLVIYLPGIVFRSDELVDFAVETVLTLDHIMRNSLKLLHACMDQRGTITMSSIADKDRLPLSGILNGPIANLKSVETKGIRTLRELLGCLPPESFHQVILMPAAMICAIYDKFHFSEGEGRGLGFLQKRFVDGLILGARGDHLQNLEDDMEKVNVWDGFMASECVQARLANMPADIRRSEEYYAAYNKRVRQMHL